MKRRIMLVLCSVCTTVAMFVTAPSSLAQQTATTTTVPVRIAVTANVASDKRMPQINPEDVVVKQGKQRLQVTSMVSDVCHIDEPLAGEFVLYVERPVLYLAWPGKPAGEHHGATARCATAAS